MDLSSASRTTVMQGLPVAAQEGDLAQSLKADLLTSLEAIGRQGEEGGLEVPCPIAPPLISPPATPNHDLPHSVATTTVPVPLPEHRMHAGNTPWWETPVAPAKSWCAPPDCLELLQRPGQNCVELLQQRSQADCVEVFRNHKRVQKTAPKIPRQIPARQQQSLSANAPEFVPEGTIVVPAAFPSLAPLEMQRTQLEDSIRDILKNQAAQVMPVEVATVPAAPLPKSSDVDNMGCSSMLSKPSAGPGDSPNEDAEVCHPTISVDDLPDHIPSIGSLNHESGDCRRCNFFHKGRCQNARSCAFCHFPHEKRKPGRKEAQENSVRTPEEAAGMQVTCGGAPGLELPDQSSHTISRSVASVSMGSRTAKVSMGTQTEDDLPPCLLCGQPSSVEEMTVEKVRKKVTKEEKALKQDHAAYPGIANAARIGGC